ncbi:PTS sugar transporter subunit IIC [Microaerobacter geothermalis]|uniref:PTS transporter subunit IIC n=1 Tax=Microaerobacter geothermalis TaxID=674972 RepID=UPI001F425362|nr:PTS sugar transporter subunit IIC [Microaerobacter geothermalis]MCF6093722.1 PTS sugar transporter subunit IIC [Microaerobacter geothermalis]
MKAFLERKNIKLSAERYFITSLNYMALGLFSSLIIGLILKVIGEQSGWNWLVESGKLAMSMMGPAIGVAVAFGLEAPPLVIFSSVITGLAGAQLGGPAGSFVAAVFGAEFGKMVSKETKVDIIVTPMVTILVGLMVARLIGPGIDQLMKSLGLFIMWATELRPILMGILVATVMGLALTAPISSAAIAIMLDLKGLAAGAATVGCAAQMIGFAVSSYRENGIGGLLAQGLGTSMIQIPNIVRNPWILLPPTVAGAILGPMATTWFQMENVPTGAGMGTSGLVGQFGTVAAMGLSSEVIVKILLLQFFLPALISLIFSELLRKWGKIKYGDMTLRG